MFTLPAKKFSAQAMQTASKCFGKFLRRLRKAKGLSQEEFGDILDVEGRYVSKLENGKINVTCATIDSYLKKLRKKHIAVFNPALFNE
ncbi:MAG: helix-turn-helix transcriptional regulator [Bacteroidetes bacterium]|nr:helix-turn-helix transcriptional regulator [Bacteroidota bacterium]